LALVPFLQLLAMLMVCVLAGQPVARRLNLDALHRITFAALSGVVLIFIFEFIGWLFNLPGWLTWFPVIALCGWSLFVLFNSSGKQSDIALDGLALWSAVGFWILALQFQIVVYGGVTWFGDWYEHYERAILFLDHLPAETHFHLGMWTLPARGPIFNAVASFFMRSMGRDFASYQVFATGLNTLAVLPMTLLLRDLAGLRQRTAMLLGAGLFGLSPFAVQHEVFTATKFLTVAYILGAIHFYLYGQKRNSPELRAWSIPAFAAGVLVHYLTVLIALFFVVHLCVSHLYAALKEGKSSRPFVLPVACSILLLGLWFGTCFAKFGIKATLQANSTLGDSYSELVAEDRQAEVSWTRAFAGNLYCTFVPYGWRHEWQGLGHAERVVQADTRWGEDFVPKPEQQERLAEWFCDLSNNACSLTGGLGWAGMFGLIFSCVLYAKKGLRRESEVPQPETARAVPGLTFWLAFALLGIPLNVLASRDYQSHGVAHLNLMPFICLAAVWLASAVKTFDVRCRLAFGIVFVLESLLTSGAIVYLQARPVPIILKAANRISIRGEIGLNPRYVDNYFHKLKHGAVFLSDSPGTQVVASLLAAALAVALLLFIWRSDSGQREASAL